MSPEVWQNLGEAFVLVTVGGYAAWKARNADRQTKETGNGWAKEVRDSLGRIEGKIDGHLKAHADADVHRQIR